MIRDFVPEDYSAVLALHEASKDNYQFPPLILKTEQGDIRHPLFVSAKVIERDGHIVLFMAGRVQAEMYMLADRSKWAEPEDKMSCIRFLDKAVRYDLWLKGIDESVCYGPPTKKRFVRRIIDWLGYQPPREGWTPLSRPTKETQ